MTEKAPADGRAAEWHGPSFAVGTGGVDDGGLACPFGMSDVADTAPSASASTEFDRIATAPRRARQYVTIVLGALYVPDALAERAVLVTSELVTNAVRHGKAGPVRLGLDLRGDVLTLTVADRTPYVPLPDAEVPQVYQESGRGLALVEALSARWGHRPADGDPACGTEVWAELTASDT